MLTLSQIANFIKAGMKVKRCKYITFWIVWFLDFSDLLVFPKEYNILKEHNISKTERFS